MLYKPYGILSQFTPENGMACLSDLGKKLPPKVYPVGRLDMNSEGLLILTDDASMNALILRPEKKVQKTYLVLLDGCPSSDKQILLSQEIVISIDGKKHSCRFDKIEFIDPPKEIADITLPIKERSPEKLQWIRVILSEGKNRQIRKMTAHLGFPALRVIRVGIGRISLGNLAPGEWKETDRNTLLAQLY